MTEIPEHAQFDLARSQFIDKLMAQTNDSPKPKSLWQGIKDFKRRIMLLGLAGATAIAGQALNKTDILAREEMMAHSDWKTTGGVHLATETDRLKFIFFGPAVGKTEARYFITNNPSAKPDKGESVVIVDAPDQVVAKAKSLVSVSDRVTRLSGDLERSIAGQRGMDGKMGHPVNGLRLTKDSTGATNEEMVTSLDITAYSMLEQQQKTTGIAYTDDWYRYQIAQTKVDLRNMFSQAQMDIKIRMERIKDGWNVMLNGKEAIETPKPL